MTEARRLLLLLTGINLVNYMDRYVVAAVLEPLGRELHLSNAQLGRLQPIFESRVHERLLERVLGRPLAHHQKMSVSFFA